jgi:hypothetical protein
MIEYTFHSDWRHVAVPFVLTMVVVAAAVLLALS